MSVIVAMFQGPHEVRLNPQEVPIKSSKVRRWWLHRVIVAMVLHLKKKREENEIRFREMTERRCRHFRSVFYVKNKRAEFICPAQMPKTNKANAANIRAKRGEKSWLFQLGQA